MPSSLPHISKTEFTTYLTCPGYAWHARYRPDLLPQKDDSVKRKFRDGQTIEEIARGFFPDGVEIPYGTVNAAVEHTATAIAAGHTTLFQATAIAEAGMLARADVLIRVDDGWHLIEIKSSSTDPSSPNSMIKKHLDDVTYQTIAFRQAGFPIVQTSVLAINRTYRRNGDISVHDLFVTIDVTNEVHARCHEMQPVIDSAIEVLLNDRVPALCECHRKTRSNRCELFSHFHPHIPDRGTIYNIANIQRATLLPALDRGILMMVDWPDDLKLSGKQKGQVALARSGSEIVQHDKLTAFLDSLQTPLWFLDYETFQRAVPLWDGYGPHQQIPFQYSLHRWEPGFDEPVHLEYLAEYADVDTAEALLQQLAQDIEPLGSVVVWNRKFERDRNKEMADRFPQHADFLLDVNARMIDLGDVVNNGWWDHPAFQGSWSLKQVLPVAAPDLSYKDLEIGDGSTASERWMQCVLDSPDELSDTERADVLTALRAYCKQDTLAMYRIYQHLLGLLANVPI